MSNSPCCGPCKGDRHWLTRKHWLRMVMVAMVSAVLLGASDDRLEARFDTLGHKKLMCVCGCNQILLECNHVGCTYSDRMRNELMTGLSRGDSDDLVLQAFLQKYGRPALVTPPVSGLSKVAFITFLILPFVILLAGFVIAILIVISWKNKPLPQAELGFNEFREQARRETEL
jgi:cytochrome c-type biogenesis protein CcmH/NrfF